MQRVAPLERFTPALCEALGIPGAGTILHSLARRGLFVELRETPPGWYALGAPSGSSPSADGRRATRRPRPCAPRQRAGSATTTSRRRRCAASRRSATSTRSPACFPHRTGHPRERVSRHGARGGRAARPEPTFARARDARRRGVPPSWRLGRTRFGASSARPELDVVSPALAWRIGLLHHLGGRLDEAFAAYDRRPEG